jgi:hypothetical protein
MSKSHTAAAAKGRKLRSNGPLEEDTEREIQFQTLVGSRSPSLSSNDGVSERTLNSGDDLSTFGRNKEGEEEIELLSTKNVTVYADCTSNAECERAALRPTTNVSAPNPAATLPPASLAMDPMLMMVQMMAQMQQQARDDRIAAEQQDRDQMEELNAQMEARAEAIREQARIDNLRLQEQMINLQARLNSTPAMSGPLRGGKPPTFDLEKDRANFNTWRSKWGYHLKLSGLLDLAEPRKSELTRAELNAALSDATIVWLDNENITPEEREDTEFIINRLEEYIKGSTNAMVAIVDALKMKQPNGMTMEVFVRNIKEMIRICNIEKIEDIKDWLCVLCACFNVSSNAVRTKLLLTKDLTFQKAIDIMFEE